MNYPSVTILMTATCRWEVIKRTLDSFDENLFKDYPRDITLLVNLDPIGPDLGCRDTKSKIKDHHISSNVVVWEPSKPSFPKAYKELWLSFMGDYAFMLEDDWELTEKVSLKHMVETLQLFPKLASLRLPFKPTGDYTMKNWKYFFPWNGHYFECPSHRKLEVGYCGHPSLLKGDFVRQCSLLLREDMNPEKQFHHSNKQLLAVVDKWEFGVYGKPNQPAYIHDIGRGWMIDNGYHKKGNKAWFTEWEKSC